jgi:hypothetical protein
VAWWRFQALGLKHPGDPLGIQLLDDGIVKHGCSMHNTPQGWQMRGELRYTLVQRLGIAHITRQGFHPHAVLGQRFHSLPGTRGFKPTAPQQDQMIHPGIGQPASHLEPEACQPTCHQPGLARAQGARLGWGRR